MGPIDNIHIIEYVGFVEGYMREVPIELILTEIFIASELYFCVFNICARLL